MNSNAYDGELDIEMVVEGGRARRSTIERFNDELAVLDRPLENDVEYYDDPPARPGWRRVVAVMAGAALLGCCAAFALTRGALAGAASAAGAPVLVRSAAAPAAPIAPVALNEGAPVPAADHRRAEAPADVESASEAGPSSVQPSHGDWTQLKPATRAKHGRARAQHARSRHQRLNP